MGEPAANSATAGASASCSNWPGGNQPDREAPGHSDSQGRGDIGCARGKERGGHRTSHVAYLVIGEQDISCRGAGGGAIEGYRVGAADSETGCLLDNAVSKHSTAVSDVQARRYSGSTDDGALGHIEPGAGRTA